MRPGLPIVKMSGSGNDFVVLGPASAAELPADPSEWIRRVCRRRISVGADGVLIVQPAGPDRVRVRFFNPDGTPAFCGNGSRCAARFASLQGLAGPRMTLETQAGDLAAEVEEDRVRLEMPPPRDLGTREVEVPEARLAGRMIDAGVPHFVVEVEAPSDAPLAVWGPAVRRHETFGPAGTNLDLVAYREDGAVEIRTWERGVEGETLACGSGAVAAAGVLGLRGGPRNVRVLPASGVPLEVELRGEADRPAGAVLRGDARVVFEAVLDEEAVR